MMHWLKSTLAGKPTLPDGGGLALPRNKPGLPTDGTLQTLQLPETLTLPLINYRREPLEPLVAPGQYVCVGDLLATDLPASASGTILAIEPRAISHPSALQARCVVIACDASQAAEEATLPALPELTLQRLQACGVVGLGGAAFATAVKFGAQRSQTPVVNTLIINAVECEPLISCDEALMMACASDVTQAVDAMIEFSACTRCLIAIEDDKVGALQAMQTALQQSQHAQRIELTTLPAIYPSGAERVLIQRLTGQSVPATQHPLDLGIVCINVATALAAWHAQRGYPLVSRIITVAGSLAEHPVNVRVRFGTRVADVLTQTGNDRHLDSARIRVGGPLSGFDLHDINAPITARTNSLLVESHSPAPQAQPCIRCSACSDACPVGLLPQELYRFARDENSDSSVRFGLDACIECGCCDLVCPSRIALTRSFRFAKDALREQQAQSRLADKAKRRHEQHVQRMQQRQAALERKRQAARERLAAAAQQEASATESVSPRTEPENTASEATVDPIAAALQRARLRRVKKSAVRSGPNAGGPVSGERNDAAGNAAQIRAGEAAGENAGESAGEDHGKGLDVDEHAGVKPGNKGMENTP